MSSNLRRHELAMAALRELAIDEAAVAEIGLGLRDSYARTGGEFVTAVLSYPLATSGGRTRFGCVNLPGITGSPEHDVAWSAGEPGVVMRGRGEGTVVVAGSPVDVWRLGLAASRLGVDAMVVASSQPDRVPVKWGVASFWHRWSRIVVLPDVCAAVRDAIARTARRRLEIGCDAPLPRPGVAAGDRADEWLSDLLETAGRIGGSDGYLEQVRGDLAGDFPAEPVPVHGGLSRGMLLYPFTVERRARAGLRGSGLLHSYETMVLRGDGVVLSAGLLPAPPGTPPHRRVHALSDGTRVASPPEASRSQSWSLEGIRSFVEDRVAGRDPVRRSPASILRDLHALLLSRVALPRPEDAWLVVGFVAMSHMFRVFSALPLLLVQGARGSGKSELGSFLADTGFNATVMGRGSGAALVRLAADCGGLVVLDDVEELVAGAGFGDLGQCLKLGYKAATARKPVATSSGRVRTLDFFGPRAMTTTRGVDAILGSRCLTVATSPDTSARPPCDVDVASLRCELHALAMSRTSDVASLYAVRITEATSRASEIRAPLLAIADAFAMPAIAAAI